MGNQTGLSTIPQKRTRRFSHARARTPSAVESVPTKLAPMPVRTAMGVPPDRDDVAAVRRTDRDPELPAFERPNHRLASERCLSSAHARLKK